MAAAPPNRIGAGASFHGGGLVTDKPDSPHLLAPKIKARMYFAAASNDDARQPDAKDKLKQSFEAAKVPAEIEVYSGALHGWCVPDKGASLRSSIGLGQIQRSDGSGSRRQSAAEQFIQQARSRLAQADANRKYAQTAPQQVSSTRARVRAAIADVEQKRALLEQAQLNLQYTKILALVSGEVNKTVVLG
jgi:dienelactone hydrolase